MKFLHVDRLTKSFGGINAVKCLKFSVNEGEITAVIGPNGAGKTTLFNLVTGVIKPDAGQAGFKKQVRTKCQGGHAGSRPGLRNGTG